jgi:predicted nucleotide-binding protein
VKDWRWDFQLGKVLLSEIDTMCRECHIAIFLVTKDDQLLQSRGDYVESPRDNIVFEVGYFAARLGVDHTLLIVEKGAKLPSDWGGILYIPLKDRANLAEVHLSLLDALGKVLPT